MEENKKIKTKRIIIAAIALLAILAAAGYVFVNSLSDGNNNVTTTKSQASEVQTTEPGEEPSVTEDDTTTSETTTKAIKLPSFVKKGYWYLFDDSAKAAIAFSFKDGGEVEAALYNKKNIEDGDPEITKGYGKYTYDEENNTLVITDLPKEMNSSEIVVEIGKKNISCNGIKAENFDKLSIDIVFDHFGV